MGSSSRSSKTVLVFCWSCFRFCLDFLVLFPNAVTQFLTQETVMPVEHRGVIAVLVEGQEHEGSFFLQRSLFHEEEPPTTRIFTVSGQRVRCVFEENVIKDGKSLTIYRCSDSAALSLFGKSKRWEKCIHSGPLTFASVQLEPYTFLH